MKLISAYIDNFGMLSNCRYNFRDGINTILSKNGTGKSTLASFIKAMLYGIGETRKIDIAENDRKRYTPWQGGRFGGSLTFSVGEKTYTVERSFGAKASLDEFRLIDTKSGAISTDFSENLGEELFGIDRDGFERTVMFSEKNLLGKNDNKSISGKLSDLVGTEFDIGEYDKAMTALEDKRKFYFKRGGGGEIGALKKELSIVEGTLDALSTLTARANAESAQIANLKSEIKTLEGKSERIRQNVEKIGIIKENLAKEAVYQDMLATLKSEENKFFSIKSFFKGEIPTQSEIDEAIKKQSQMQAMLGNREFVNSEEYIALDTFFKSPTSFEEIDSALNLSIDTDRLKREKQAIADENDERTKNAREIFKRRVPTRREIDEMSRLAEQKTTSINPIVAIICTLLFALSVIFGFVIHYFAFAISLIAIVIFALTGRVKKPNTALNTFISEIDSSLLNMQPKEAINEISARLNRYEELLNTDSYNLEILSEKINDQDRRIFTFLAKFPLINAPTVIDAIRQIKEKYLKYYSMQMAREHIALNKYEFPYSTDELKLQLNAFLARFNVKSDTPFDEIRRALAEYNVQAQTVAKMRTQCEDYKARHALVGKSAPLEAQADGDVTALKKITDEITLRREALQRMLREHENTLNEFTRRDELVTKENVLKNKIEQYERELATVQNTMHYLKCACDNITDRYLGKTIEGFSKYQKQMSGNDGEFSLDTEFSLSKTEGSQTHSESSYSRGTRDLYALAIRLSLIDSLYEGELPFIILDDPFIAFDDEKVQRSVGVLKKLANNRQIIYLTCSQARSI